MLSAAFPELLALLVTHDSMVIDHSLCNCTESQRGRNVHAAYDSPESRRGSAPPLPPRRSP